MLPFFGLSLALGYERAKRAWKQLFAGGVRTDVMHQEMREEWEQEEENKQKAKLDEYLTEKEQDGLGGILQLAPWPRLSCEALEVSQVVTEVSGMSNAKWLTTQAMSLSLYHFIVVEPAGRKKRSMKRRKR